MYYYSQKKIYYTTKSFDIIDLTEDVQKFLIESGGKDGLLTVFTRHTTAIIKINESEQGFRNDLKKWCDKYVGIEEIYQHNDLETRDPKTMCDSKEECLNGHSHIRAMLIGNASENIPIQQGNLMLGRWQRILLFELDHARKREIIFTFVGS